MATQDAWSDIADEYAARVEPFTSSFVGALLDEATGHRASLEGVRLLDLACGAGALSFTAIERGARVVATDAAPGMLRALRSRAAKIPTDGLEAVVEAPGEHLPTEWAGSFDAVVSNFGLIFFDDVGAGCASAASCLAPGGRLALSCWGSPEQTEAFQVIKKACARCGIEASQAAPRRITGTVESLTQLLTDGGGLADVRVVGPVERILRVASAEDFWLRFALAAPATRRLLASLEAAQAERLHAEVLAMLGERFGGGEVALPASAYFAIGGVKL